MTADKLRQLATQVLEERNYGLKLYIAIDNPREPGIWAMLFRGVKWIKVTFDQQTEDTDEKVRAAIRAQLEAALATLGGPNSAAG